LGYFSHLRKKYAKSMQSKKSAIAQWAKVRPIMSPCYLNIPAPHLRRVLPSAPDLEAERQHQVQHHRLALVVRQQRVQAGAALGSI
jgi:hypothetical protein